MNILRYVILAIGTIAWFAPFPVYYTRGAKGPLTKDYAARWGILLECVAYSLLWQGHFWLITPAFWQFALSVLLFVIAAVTSWTASIALGRYLRVDAALDTEHELIRSGAYRFVRNPIYSSMLCVILATALLVTPLWLFSSRSPSSSSAPRSASGRKRSSSPPASANNSRPTADPSPA